MHVKIMILLLALEIIDVTDTTTLRANKLIQNICDTLYSNNSLQAKEDKQWKMICQELFYSKDDHQYRREQRSVTYENDVSQTNQMGKAAVRGIRTGIRIPSSGTRFQNIRTGATLSRPNGWQWSRAGLIFLPIATRYFYRSRSSSNRFTTRASSSVTYYYCTSSSDPSIEIQCSSADGDKQCCEDESTQQAFCCGGEIPDYMTQDASRPTQTLARIFYTLAALALCMHFLMRRFHRF